MLFAAVKLQFVKKHSFTAPWCWHRKCFLKSSKVLMIKIGLFPLEKVFISSLKSKHGTFWKANKIMLRNSYEFDIVLHMTGNKLHPLL